MSFRLDFSGYDPTSYCSRIKNNIRNHCLLEVSYEIDTRARKAQVYEAPNNPPRDFLTDGRSF
jgi:hypothetical protein